MRTTEVGAGANALTHYYGLVSNGGGYLRGCASGVPAAADPTTVASGPTGNPAGPGPVPVNVTGDTDGSFGDWYGGHELGHTFGRSHPGFCNGNSADDPSFPNPNGQISDNNGTHTGLDVGDTTNTIPVAVLPGATRFDIMTYCNQPQWPSAYAYEGVRARLNAENPTGAGPPSSNGSGATQAREIVTSQHSPLAPPEKMYMGLKEGRFVSIVATLNLTRHTGKILYVNHVQRALVVPQQVMEGRAFIRLFDRGGKLLGQFPSAIREDTDIPPGEDRTALIDVVIQEFSNVGRVELVVDGKLLDGRKVSLRPPVVKRVQISNPDRKGFRVARWEASHPEKLPLTYLVQISSDGGKTWETLAVGLRVPRLDLTPEQLKDRAGATIRVTANDGYNNSEPVTASLPGTSVGQRQ